MLSSCEKDKPPFDVEMSVSETLFKADYVILVNGENRTKEEVSYTLIVNHGDEVSLTVYPETGSKGVVRCLISHKHQWEINAYNQVGEKTITFAIP